MPVRHTITVLLCVVSWIFSTVTLAATVPGSEIINRAILTYLDTFSGERIEVESNTSSITVVELRQFTLTAEQSVNSGPGEVVQFLHTLTNTGNVDDQYFISVYNELSDQNDLDNLQLSIDTNGNGQKDVDEPLVDGPVSVAVNSSVSLLVSGQLPQTASPGELVQLTLLAASSDSTLASIFNTDSVTVLEPANLSLSLTNSPECTAPLAPGQVTRYTLTVKNDSDTLPIERQVLVDGVLLSGVLIELAIPAGMVPSLDGPFDTDGYQARALVKTSNTTDESWVSVERWAEFAPLLTQTQNEPQSLAPPEVSSLAVLMPQSHFTHNELITVRFDFALKSDVFTLDVDRTFDVEAVIDFNDDDLPDSQSNFVCNTPLKLAASLPASIHFIEPVSELRTDIESIVSANDDHFQETELYRINYDVATRAMSDVDQRSASRQSTSRSGLDYQPLRDGVYIELRAAVSERLLLKNAAGQRFVSVNLSSAQTRDSLIVLLAETSAASNRFRSVSPVMLNTTEAGQEQWCPGAATSDTDQILQLTSQLETCVLLSDIDDKLRVSFVDPYSGVDIEDLATVEPASRVFDSTSLETLAGAVVTVYRANQIVRSTDDNQPLVFTTDKSGRFFLPRLPPGTDYSIGVDPPDGYLFPSRVAQDRFTTFSLTNASYGEAGFNGAGQGRFVVSETPSVLVIDIPVDPANRDSLLQIEKRALSDTVELGDAIGYQIQLSNRGSGDLDRVTVLDTPPYGFRFISGSLSLDGQQLPDPDAVRLGASELGMATGADASVVAQSYLIDIGSLVPGQQRTLSYHLQATSAALNSDGVNTALATAITNSGVDAISQSSRARVRVTRTGVMSEQAMIFGKVYVDSSCDWIQNKAEWPVGGVKLYLQDGSFVVTDEDGQYSLFGVAPGLHVLKVDPLTLPLGLSLKPVDNRNAADAQSRFVDLSNGDFHRADFATNCPTIDSEGVFERLASRNRSLRGSWLIDEASRFNPDGKARIVNDRQRAMADGDLSSGLLAEPRTVLPKDADIDSPSPGGGARAVSDPSMASESAASAALTNESLALEADVLPVRPANTSSVLNSQKLLDAETVNHTAKTQIAMGDPKQLVASITSSQAQEGTWLWPENAFSTDGRFMAVVRAGTSPELYVNGVGVSSSQIGERLENRRERAELVTWYGVSLKPGVNTLEIKGLDSFGNARILASGQFKRPAAGVRMMLRTRQDTLPADGGRTFLPIDVVINDANGYPANGVYFVTLQTTAGDFLEQDLQSNVPGVQVRIENGRGKIHIRSSELAGRMKLTARSGNMQAQLNLIQVAAARPLVGVGLLELGGRWNQLSRGDERAQLDEGFEHKTRAALFLKGRIKKDMKLTLSYDSDKDKEARLLRDINPNEHYPTIGDASVKGFEAQSRSKLYAKLERDRHSVMWGDYLTDNSPNADNLARVQRTLTGFNAIYQSDRNYVQLFMARQSDIRASEEIRGNGTAMLFRLSGAPIVPNSEVIERLVRDRDNPGLVIRIERLQRFRDYTLDATSGLLSFSDVVPSLDEALNPVFIRASYDRTSDLDEYLVSGLRWQYTIADRVTAGVSLTDDQNPLSGYTVAGAHTSISLGLNTQVALSSAVMSHRDEQADGAAHSVRLEHHWGGNREHRTLMSWSRAAPTYTNTDAGISAGREEWRAEHYQPLSRSLTATVKGNLSESTVDSTHYGSAGLNVVKKFTDWSVTGGARRVWSSDGSRSLKFNTLLVGAERRLRLPGSRSLVIGAEAERDIADSERYRYALHARLQLFDHVSIYSRYERENQLSQLSLTGARDGARQWVLGVESDLLPATQLYSEYRMRGSLSGRNIETASGVRGRYQLVPGLSINPSLEVIDVDRGTDAADSIAVSLGVSDSRNPNRKLNAQAEVRDSAGSRYYGFRATLAQRLNLDWTTLVREEFTRQTPAQGQMSSRHQFTLGLARRPKLDNQYHAVFLANWKQDYGPEEGQDKRTYLLSSHHNRQLGRGFSVSGRLGIKWQSASFNTATIKTRATVMDARGTYDINRRWELDARAGWLGVNGRGDDQYSLGVGLSWIVDRNMRLGVAYNLIGFNEQDLDAQGFNQQGLQLGLQIKFDEEWFQWLSD